MATPKRTVSTEAMTGRVKRLFSQKASTKHEQGMMHSLAICSTSRRCAPDRRCFECGLDGWENWGFGLA